MIPLSAATHIDNNITSM